VNIVHQFTLVSFIPPGKDERMYKVCCTCGWSTRHHYHVGSAEHEAARARACSSPGRMNGPWQIQSLLGFVLCVFWWGLAAVSLVMVILKAIGVTL
jgi:hypothetical protein